MSGSPKYSGNSANKQGIIDMPSDAEGWPEYAAGIPVVDNDHDGMADSWETANGFNPADPEDGKQVVSAEGYTALEVYLNSLMGEKISITTTAIRTVKAVSEFNTNAPCYNLSGQKVGKVYTKAAQKNRVKLAIVCFNFGFMLGAFGVYLGIKHAAMFKVIGAGVVLGAIAATCAWLLAPSSMPEDE